MIIDKISLHHIHMQLKTPFETSFGKINSRECILVEAFSAGLQGWGECVADRDPGYSYETVKTAWHILKDFLSPAIIGHEIKTPFDFHPLIRQVRGHQMAKSGVEMALWDLYGKLENKSLSELLGGKRGRVDVGVSVGIQSSPEALVDIIAGYLDQGYQRVKIKIKPNRDIAEAQAVRGTYPNLHLQVDANSAYTLETSSRLLPLDELDLLLIEQPLDEDDLWDHSKLQKKFKTPLCLDESIITPRHARQAIEMGACRVINIKTGRVGGLSQAVIIHDYCHLHGIPVWCGGMLETGVGRAANLALASLPNFVLPGDISATDRYYEEDITEQRFLLNPDSSIDVPKQPGLGVTINQHALAKVTKNYITISKN